MNTQNKEVHATRTYNTYEKKDMVSVIDMDPGLKDVKLYNGNGLHPTERLNTSP